ncbi:MAG: TrkH family potassium uptake protein [Thermoleophilia bacterium]
MVAGFAALILFGSLLLMLPWATTAGETDYLTSLFISTSAVCVTGLIVVDFPNYYTAFGQTVVLVLIQAGGFGVMAGAALVFQLVGRRLSLRSEAALRSSLFPQGPASAFRILFRRLVLLTIAAEVLGTLVLFVGLISDRNASDGAPDALFSALFQSISAFNNAGFSTYSDSLTGLAGNPLVVAPIALLIIAGGLGGIVLIEVYDAILAFWRTRERRPFRRLSLHTRTVLLTSALLIAGGALLLEAVGLPEGRGPYQDVADAVFQSLTARTAGFNTVDIGALPAASLVLLIGLMFIGGSPASTAGGVKTTTVAIWLAEVWAALRRREDAVILKRSIPPTIVRRALLLISLSSLWNFGGVLLLLLLERETHPAFLGLLFEQISAFGTVGLSTGITAQLSGPSQIWIIVTMFVGRLGPLLLASWALRAEPARVHYASGRMLIG